MKDFLLSWRFTDPSYNKLPKKDLESIHPNSEEESILKWNELVSSQPHINTSFFGIYDTRFKVDTDDEISGRKLLETKIPFSDDDNVYLFWSKKCSVETRWGTIKRYWTDFFYPDDDNTVIVFRNIMVTYSEESFFIFKKE